MAGGRRQEEEDGEKVRADLPADEVLKYDRK